ncbi:MAG: hypothetical protein JWM25_916 [Thermoleophilia bacterium]|nr:hypothetical protein [Thermoleophilia bacterium]MCZ4496333.1 hypothetical protein [Thermoleophilia bacterium]
MTESIVNDRTSALPHTTWNGGERMNGTNGANGAQPRDIGEEIFGPVCDRIHCTSEKRAALEHLIELAVELAREGREGRKIGTLFVVGDHEAVLKRSRPLLLDPLQGHAAEVLHIERPELRETIKELSQLDGAFIVDWTGTFVSAARYIATQLDDREFTSGLGTRHAAGQSISKQTKAVAIVVSQSSVVRVYSGGELLAEIIPELYMMSKERLFTPHASVRTLPKYGLSIAVSEEDGAA